MGWYKAGHREKDTKDSTASFVHNRNRENIKSGETHSTIFGKIARYFADLKMVAFTGDYDDLNGKPPSFPPSSHKHAKSDITDFPSSMPASDVKAWAKAANKPSYTAAETGAVSAVSASTGSGNSVPAGHASLAVGLNNGITKWQSACIGAENKNDAYNSLVSGYGNKTGEGGSGLLLSGDSLSAEDGSNRAVCFGYANTAKNDMVVIGHQADSGLMEKPHVYAQGTQGTAFTIGNGSGSRSNCFRVNYDGTVYSKGSYNTTGADYAEYFEWADGNPGSEDRTGLFVTLEGDKIMPAHEGDYILGIISANPSVTGNSDEHWAGQFKKDVFNRYVIEERPVIIKEIKMETLADKNGNPVLDRNGNTVITVKEEEKECIASTYVENEDYDRDKAYIHRADRPEWDTVGLLGQLVCCDDGTCQVNGYCKCSQNGMATAAAYEEGSFQTPVYKVMERVADGLIKVLVK